MAFACHTYLTHLASFACRLAGCPFCDSALCHSLPGVPILRQLPLPPLAGGPHFEVAPLATVLTGKTSAIFVGLLLFIF